MTPEWVKRQRAMLPQALVTFDPDPTPPPPDLWQQMRGPHEHTMPLTKRVASGKGDPTFKLPPPVGERQS